MKTNGIRAIKHIIEEFKELRGMRDLIVNKKKM